MTTDRRYTCQPCECGDAFCAGCEPRPEERTDWRPRKTSRLLVRRTFGERLRGRRVLELTELGGRFRVILRWPIGEDDAPDMRIFESRAAAERYADRVASQWTAAGYAEGAD